MKNARSREGRSDTAFQTIRQASDTTGLSQFYLRNGCKDGTVPHITSGKTYMVDVPQLLRQLHEAASESLARTRA